MIDISFIRQNPSEFDNYMKSRGIQSISKQIIKIDEEKRNTQTILQNLLSEKNILSKKIGIAKSKNENTDIDIKKVDKLNNEINSLKELEKIKDDELLAILNRIPNIPSKDVPIGKNENDNVKMERGHCDKSESTLVAKWNHDECTYSMWYFLRFKEKICN